MDDLPWTLEELVAEVAAVLPGLMLSQDNGQVADLPNGRVVRYYQSLCLLGRPQQRGRIAYYGYGHVVEVVAIKRLQAAGLSLTQIHAALVGRSAAEVAKVAQLPEQRSLPAPVVVVQRPFWSQPVAPAHMGTPATTVTVTEPATSTGTISQGVALHHSSGLVVVLPAGTTGPTASPPPSVMHALLTTLAAHGWHVPAAQNLTPETRGEP
jgi:DNA-binding transcriptional MerR regulator